MTPRWLASSALALLLVSVTLHPARSTDYGASSADELKGRLAEAAPRLADRIRGTATRSESDALLALSVFIGVVHPDSGRPICDHEAVAVIAADQAIRVLLPAVLTRVGMPEIAATLSAIPPMHDGNEAASHSSALLGAASRLRSGRSRDVRVLARPTRLIGVNIANLARWRAAPEEVVFDAVAELVKSVAGSELTDRDALVERYVTRVLAVLGPAAPREIERCQTMDGVSYAR